MSQEMIERSFDVGSPARLKLANIRGLIDLQLGEDGVISIKAVKHLSSGDENNTEIQIEQVEDGQVIVKTGYNNSISNLFGLRKPLKVDYTVQLPKDCEIKVSGVSCPISVQGLSGKVDINAVSGKTTLRDLSGNLNIKVVSGLLDSQNLSGEIRGSGVSGKVLIKESSLDSVVFKTVSGKMLLETPLTNGPYHFNAVSGNLSLVVPQDTRCIAEIKSVSGRLRTSLPITRDRRQGSRGLIEIGGGGPEVSFKSVSGAMRIVTSEKEEIHEMHVPEKPITQSKDKMAILKQIERGEISVEEALKEMNA